MILYYAPAADLSTENIFSSGTVVCYTQGMETVTELYTPAALARLRRYNRIWTLTVAALACAALAVCVVLCARIGTLNAKAMQWRIIAVSTLGGWLVIALWWNLLLPRRREAVHQQHMLEGEREADEGVLTVTKELHIVPKSAPLLRAELRRGQGVRRIFVSPRKAAALRAATGEVRVWTVYGCVVAWEALT